MDDKCESQDTGLFTMPSWLCRKSCQNSKPYRKIFMSASYAIFYLLRLTVRLLPKRKLLWLNLSQRYLFLATSTINLLHFFFLNAIFFFFFSGITSNWSVIYQYLRTMFPTNLGEEKLRVIFEQIHAVDSVYISIYIYRSRKTLNLVN